MTLPFRRRHHDDEGSHDRARSLSSSQLIEPLDADAATWLTGHLESCSECRRETEGFAADRELLRSLRDKPIEPPRDLWARTSAALDREAGKRGPADRRADRRSPAPRQRGTGSPWQRLPVGAAAGVLILLVVLGTAFLPGILPPKTPSGTQVAHATGVPGPTAIVIAAVPIPALRSGADGSWDLFYTEVNKVCPRSSPECVPPPGNGTTQTLGQLSAKASTMTISPDDDQLVFEATGGTAGVYVVPVPSKGTGQTPPPSATPGTGSQPPVTAEPGSPEPTPAATPVGQLEIASGVTVVGEVAYSPEGQYLAFSAAPIDHSTGPDLYVWSAGSGTAVAVTSDHATYFSGWLGSQVLASHLAVVAGPGQSGSPDSSDQPGASGGNGHGNGQGNGQGNGLQIEAHPSSFLLDPATLVRTDLAQADVWLPVVDVSARFVVYWSGTLTSKDGLTWELGTGQVVLDKWSSGAASPEPGTSGATGASQAPNASGLPVVGPVGEAKPLENGKVADFRAKFDPAGTHLALWIGENLQEPVGRLHLIVIDPATGAVSSVEPLPGTPALRRFSIDANRLAWVTPPGQDGQESSLQVLGWDGDSFGEIHTEPAQDLLILR